MVVRMLGWLGVLAAAFALGAPPASACSSMGPELTRSDGQPLRSVDDAVRDAGLVAEGEVIRIGTEKICAPLKPNDCREFPRTLIFRIDKPYKGALDPVVEVAPLGGCAGDGSGGVWDGLVLPGTRMLMIADITSDRAKPFYPTTARYHQVFDYLGLDDDNAAVGVPLSAWERFRRLWSDLEAHAEEHPDDPAGWRALARAMEEWRDYPRALKAYDRLAALLPRDVDIQARRGRLLFYLRMPEAEVVLSRVVTARPGDAKSRSLLALLHYQPSPGSQSDPTSSLTGLDLSNIDLRGRLFKQVDFSGSDFSGADLRYTYLDEVNFARANLSRARLFDGYPLYFDVSVTSLRNADFTGSYVEDIPPAGDYSGIKLSGVTVPADALVENHLMDADLSGARIICEPIPKAKYWQASSFHYQRETWQDHIDELKDASHAVQEQPAALLDASCSEAIRDHLHENCAPWILGAKRSPGCKITEQP